MKKGVLRNFTKLTAKHLCQRDYGRLFLLMPVILKLEDRTGEMFRLLKQSTLLFIL